ncbi:MAG: aminotransferase class V-fold PLP-dependent enzyme [Chloroflexia bacterium]|nr:aminotransferase class V-fold PLP-dependent enzyme [Chloroflexia bacterium]
MVSGVTAKQNIYQRFGVKTIINAGGPMTRLSGSILSPEVREAMSEAASACVRVEDIQEAAGKLIAEVTGSEAGYVTSGAAGGLALSAAAAIAGLDVARMDKLPDTTGMPNEIIVQREHMTAYSHALRLPGAKLVEVGYVGYPGQGCTWPWQIETEINERTVAIFYSIGNSPGAVSLPEVVEVAHRHNLPVIVDAAAALPPVGNLRRFINEEADLVCFSGGKAIAGPQASGILAGRADLIASVALQHQDMDVMPATWTWRDRYLKDGALPGPPHHGLGRPLKVGKEEIVGLMVALEQYVNRDHAADQRRWEDMLQEIASALQDVPGISIDLRGRKTASSVPIAVVAFDEAVIEQPVEAVINALIEGDPAVAVSQAHVHDRAIGINPMVLQPGEPAIVAQRLREVLGYS